ncbi:AraC family transcriptional regulator [Piscinibacter sp.]|uniref:AraC family transcriptional regulator n=1 Tax=Piscinibacter sp. TaxID=1903157 RepID=UPI002B74C99D|nr:AraC family transcriptional regulator [Albitalea sp.]HUG23014.1 AraC family transcriptional regulator [Albitalea sp.]
MNQSAVPRRFEHPQDAAEFRQVHRPGIELYRAHIVRYAFDPHTHDAFGLGAIDSGVERFRYRGAEHLAPPQSLVLMNPDMLHTGRAETEQGWRYRMIYLDAQVLEQVTGERGWWFAEPVGRDAMAARRVSELLTAMWQCHDPLAIDGGLLALTDLLRPYARGTRPVEPPRRLNADLALDRAIALMNDRLADGLTLDQLAGAAGLSPFHFLRRFKARHHATPHQMLMALRLFRAKQRLAAGIPPAAVAAEVGLVDQAHLTRRFARMYGVTPARYQRQLGARCGATDAIQSSTTFSSTSSGSAPWSSTT